MLISCTSAPPQDPDNICNIFKEKRSWYKAAKRTEDRWKLPPYVLMSFIFQESSYQAKIRPEREKLFGVIPWTRPSSAKGYSQPLVSTWEDYKKETGNRLAVIILQMLLILLGGMLLKDIFKDLIKGMQGHYILLIMRVITDLRIKHTEKNNG